MQKKGSQEIGNSDTTESTNNGPKVPQEDVVAVSSGNNSSVAKLNLPKVIAFSDLARCGEEVWIECEGQLYRLRQTKQKKLILTK